jgi:hypothetical protein
MQGHPSHSRCPPTSRGRRTALLSLVAAIVVAILVAGAGSASASAPIEGIWSFNGGEVGIQQQSGGTFVGTVVAATKFAHCVHNVGEPMWTDMTPQPDGSYWGLHQWFKFSATEECAPLATGPTAWRVLPAPDGSRFLRVCFSEPGGEQPTIAPDGSSAHVSFECADSALVAALPEAPGGRYVTLPSNSSCVARKKLHIQLRDPKNDPWGKIVVKLKGGGVRRLAKVRRHGKNVTATLSLRGLSASPFTVTIHATTVLGNHLSRKRTYSACSTIPPVHLHKAH